MANPVVSRRFAQALAFGSSGAVLVLEIVAGRLVAPYVGVSLETFTGIIGTMLAGIAVGATLGGRLADARDPAPWIGPALILGGVLAWLSLPIVRGLGPQFGSGRLAIVVLASCAFVLPSVALSAVTPMVAKLQLSDLSETGSVVGGLSAAGTVGALAGSFLTGFVLLATLTGRQIVLTVGAVTIVAGVIAHWRLVRRRPDVATLMVVAVAGLALGATASNCQRETAYFCVNVVDDTEVASGRSLILDQLRHGYINLDDPTDLDIRYVRVFAQIADALPDGPIRSLHIGGGAFAFPRYLEVSNPGSTSVVLEIDGELVDVARERLGLVTGPELEVQVGDARLALDRLADDEFSFVLGDAFSGPSVPWHLTTVEFVREIARVMTDDGVYVMNVIDAGPSAYARAQAATLRAVFDHVAVILPADGVGPSVGVNHVLVASQVPLPDMAVDRAESVVFADTIEAFIDDAGVLRDDFAPVDQLATN